jgi:hypothetical protein
MLLAGKATNRYSMSRKLPAIAAVLLAAAGFALVSAGCGTPGGGIPECTVRLGQDGCLYANEKPVKLADLGRTLKSAGAGPATMIRVSVPEGRTDILSSLTRQLTASGFRRVVFTLPQKASATTQADK